VAHCRRVSDATQASGSGVGLGQQAKERRVTDRLDSGAAMRVSGVADDACAGLAVRAGCLVFVLFAAQVCAAAPAAAQANAEREFTFYAQQAWPKQTTTNKQIQDINEAFGTNFDDWGDVPNLSVGAQLLWRVAPGWKLGVQVDYGSGSIDGTERVLTDAGPAKLSFEQKYHVYTDVYAIAKWNPWPAAERVRPFLYGGIGMAYESDATTLRLHNEFVDSGLRAENHGWFPTYSAGIGVDVPWSATSKWYFEFGVAYVWARMTNEVLATGDLAPAPMVTADTDLTGPNYWLGVGRSF
jgi:hypothetical protein